MGRYEELMNVYHDEIYIDDTYSLCGKFKGFYDNGVILIDKHLPQHHRLEILAEEIAHHKLTYGDITDQSVFNNRKFEGYARRHAMENIISIQGIIDAFKNNLHNLYEVANYFEVSEGFVQQCIINLKLRYGLSTIYKGYLIQFEPLRVFEYKKLNSRGYVE
ncbi:ImmA/IrrE family metallo-endopeptidase [Staphylococcus saprophyticus]|nr:ImmA/IrrE family metallo-endopeptidase [Staphylococcus saprophyticus]MDW4149027.1 ImmA/IrrE family metallo-endopeptidase [Staphylococcus saprophyticus]MDW4377838.1 ImmA/IrrE family metallo-endopeptidase [Staphylococcus saprophyticus]MDW4444943.1 ImmA/IrrE family metallo-endopeptidase [Staphylococcus saprophyticus]MDW4456665.1 ImmA/IrrE family metallo-endopeptidase [Staphylococcus saprophyticus]